MTENIILYLCGGEEKEQWRAACESLWIDVFGDSREFVTYYMESTWRENQVLILPEAEQSIASMLHMNPYTLCVRGERLRLHYIVGVSTKKELRSRGYMGRLLKKALRLLKSQGEPFTYLMPAAVDIYKPYQFVPVGFTEGEVRQAFLRGAELQAAENMEQPFAEAYGGLRLIPFGKLTEALQEKLSRFVNDNREGIFVLPDVSYLWGLERQMEAYDGELLTAWQGEEPVGMAAYLYVARDMPPVEVVQIALRKGQEEVVCEELHRHICERFLQDEIQLQYDSLPDIPEWRRQGEHSSLTHRKHCISMFRCLEPVWFLQRFTRPSGWKQECVVEITDEFLTENNGVYEVCFAVGQQENYVSQSEAEPEYCLNVEMLVQYWLKDTPVYTPELV